MWGNTHNLVVHGHPDPDARKELPSSISDGRLGPDDALQEGEKDAGDVLKGSDDERVATTVDAGQQGKLALLALGEVGGAQAGLNGFLQQLVDAI